MTRYADPELSPEERIDDLLSKLTLDEKIECLGTNPTVSRLGIKGTGHVEGLHGLALGGPGRWGRERPVPTTTYPQAIGLAESWDPEVLREVATIESHETRYAFQSPSYGRGGLVVRAPNADLGRDPRWGRTEECYGEDPYLCGVMAVAFVRGLQGDHARYWRTAALLKHFLANSNEDGRESSSSNFDEALFRDYYSVPFRMAVEEGGSRAFMAAYNAYNGIPCATHPVLAGVALREWKQDGILCTDGGAYRLLVTAHRAFPDLYEAAAAAIRAGITQFLDDYRDGVRGALDRGLLTEAEIEGAVRKNFRVMIRLGLLDPPDAVPYSAIGQGVGQGVGREEDPPWDSEAHRESVRRVTRSSVVLLKNEHSMLPLDRESLRSVAVVGPLADRVLVDWYSGTPPYLVSPVEGIRRKVGDRLRVRTATNNDDSDAVRVARESDVCIVCVGNHPTGDAGWAQVTKPSYGREAVDRRSLELEDEGLVKRVWEANARTIVVLITSFPYAVVWTKDTVPAILHVTHNSQELGNALADVLFGDYNPAGRLVQTWPKSIEDLPPMMDYDVRKGRTHMYFSGEPLFPFGYGLSYTTFAYRRLELGADSIDEGRVVAAGVILENTGRHDGDEVVQLYARRPDAPPGSPRQVLVGFRRAHLRAGETKAVTMDLRGKDLVRWDANRRSFALEKGVVEVMAGRSSAHIELRGRLRVV